MLTTSVATENPVRLKACHHSIPLRTRESLEFVDLTPEVAEFVRRSGIDQGFVNIQTRHTTTAIMVGENEPLLLEDMKKVLARLAPSNAAYGHDNFEIRTVNMCVDECQNGHSHCKAMLLGTSETLNIVDGAMQLGRWQRIFFVELDRARMRSVSVMVLGC